MFGGQAEKRSTEHGFQGKSNRQAPFRAHVLEVVSIETEIKENVIESTKQFPSSVVCVCVFVQ